MALSQHPTEVVGANVRAEMARRRMLQGALAEHLHLSQTGVSKRLAGETPFDINELVAIARLLEVELCQLLAGVSEDVPA